MAEDPASLLTEMFAAVSAAIERDKDRLSELDGLIGDADHGTTMALGFRSVTTVLSRSAPGAPSAMLRAAASAFLDAVGASTGPLYAAGLRRAALRLEGSGRFGCDEQVAALEAIAEGIAERGKAQRGDKTMLDVWLPAAEAARKALREGAGPPALWRRTATAAAEGAEATRSMVASRGRAARLGVRSLGHLDPGAASAAIILDAMASILGREPG